MVVKTKSRTENNRFHFSGENIHIFHLLIDKDDIFSFKIRLCFCCIGFKGNRLETLGCSSNCCGLNSWIYWTICQVPQGLPLKGKKKKGQPLHTCKCTVPCVIKPGWADMWKASSVFSMQMVQRLGVCSSSTRRQVDYNTELLNWAPIIYCRFSFYGPVLTLIYSKLLCHMFNIMSNDIVRYNKSNNI